MATVFISQKIDLTDNHAYSLLDNPKADSVIFLPESSGVNSAGQVLTVYGTPLNSGVFTERYALVITGQNGNGELTVTPISKSQIFSPILASYCCFNI